jgi:hypothetical protein
LGFPFLGHLLLFEEVGKSKKHYTRDGHQIPETYFRPDAGPLCVWPKCASSAPYWNRDYRKLDETDDSLIRAAMSQTCTERSSACANTAGTGERSRRRPVEV